MSKVRVVLEADSDFLNDFRERGFCSDPIENMVHYWLKQYEVACGCQFVPKMTKIQIGDDIEFKLGLDIRKLDFGH